MKLKAYLSNPLFSQSTRGNDRLYTGREYDGETGLYYYRAREYSPEFGRFLQRDPIGQMDQVNLYTYVGNGPMGGVDPSGEVGIMGDLGSSLINGWNAFMTIFSNQTPVSTIDNTGPSLILM